MVDPKEEVILSVIGDRNNATLIAKVAKLWIRPQDRVLDCTWGRGVWWKTFKPSHFIAHDLYTLDGVDFTNLPEKDGTIDVVAWDPPYTALGGRETSTIDEMNDAYGLKDAPATPAELQKLHLAGMEEIKRVLRPKVKAKPGGLILAKTNSYVSSGHMVLGELFTMNTLIKLGFEICDIFIHWSGTGPQPKTNRDGSPRKQVHSRRSHSVLVVARKDGKPQDVL
jgi:hypothetical protein